MNIVVYTKTSCPWCAEVLEFLRNKNVQFEEREVLKNPKFMEEMMQKSGQSKTPTLDIDGDILADTDAKAVEDFLRKKQII